MFSPKFFRIFATLSLLVSADRAGAEFRLSIDEKPVIVRASLPDSSPRSIAVGLPSGSAFCFDAALCQFRYVWKATGESGEFLDVRPLWAGRGGRDIRPLGRRYYEAPREFPIRLTSPKEAPGSVRFLGYRLLEGGAEFRYEVDGVPVTESITAGSGGEGLIRSFNLEITGRDVWFFAGEKDAGTVVTSPQGGFQDGFLKVSGPGAVRFDIVIRTEESASR